MASALSAFVASLSAKQPPPEQPAEEQFVDSEPEEDQAEAPPSQTTDAAAAPAKPTTPAVPALSLADVARANNAVTSVPATATTPAANGGQRKPSSLLDVANAQQQEQSAMLLKVAQATKDEQKAMAGRTLSFIAEQVNHEDAQAQQRRATAIQQALTETTAQVKQEAAAHVAQQTAQVLQQVVHEYEEEQFEADEADKAIIERAAKLLVAKQHASDGAGDPTANSFAPTSARRSVDESLLKQRQRQHGLRTKPSKPKTLKERLSSFQSQQKLTPTQRRLLLATLAADDAASRRRRCNMHVIEELAKHKHKRKPKTRTPEFALLDDTKHCRFRPRCNRSDRAETAKRGGHGSDDDDDSGGQKHEDFVRRMEAAERARQEGLRRTREEKLYNARVDKKECPVCGNPQSYAELTQKRKKCPNCGVTYKSRIAWGEVATDFLERIDATLEARTAWQQERQADQAQQHANLFEVALYLDHKKHHHGDDYDPAAAPATWEQVEDEFFGRLHLDQLRRTTTKEAILQDMQQECSFVPEITAKTKRLDVGTFDDRLRRDLEQRRLREERHRMRKEAGDNADDSPVQSGKPKLRPAGARPHVPTLSFQERLKQDLEKRQQRQRSGGTTPTKQTQQKRGARGNHPTAAMARFS